MPDPAEKAQIVLKAHELLVDLNTRLRKFCAGELESFDLEELQAPIALPQQIP